MPSQGKNYKPHKRIIFTQMPTECRTNKTRKTSGIMPTNYKVCDKLILTLINLSYELFEIQSLWLSL